MEIVTGSRLHFGLLHVPGSPAGPALSGPPNTRSFGGVGLMIEEPSVRLHAMPAACWQAEGPASETVLAFARECQTALDAKLCPPLAFRCTGAPPRHAGFGSGTQLGLAVARLIAHFSGQAECSIAQLAARVRRGKRSWVGIHGFQRGGFLVEAGTRGAGHPSPLLFGHPFPEDWRILAVRPTDQPAIHGNEETSLFAEMNRDEHAHSIAQELSRLLLLEVLPALLEADFEAFGEGLHAYNRKAGERFCRVQGGVFASAKVEAMIQFFRHAGCPGSGQSSWGPGTFAICRDEQQARHVAKRISSSWPTAQVIITRARNTGATAIG
jgi:beta-ribofuranosylaminobenzene 5'-phosphate synthase